MADLPTPQNATEAAEFDESWDTVLSYADLCTAGSGDALELATEAFAHGIRETRTGAGRGPGRRPATLPRIPLLLGAVRDTAADWEHRGQGHRLDPELRLWLTSAQADRFTGPPVTLPLALRGLQDMQRPDAALLWLTEVEALPLPVVAARLELDPAGITEERAEVRALFRDRCLRNHLDRPMGPQCRGYARMLDAVTRTAVADTPDDLSHHLARCPYCAEAAACLRVHGGGLPAALAGGILGWGGLAYLERRRRAAEVRLAAGRAGGAGPRTAPRPRRVQLLRGGLLAGAVLVSLIALGVSLMPFGAESDAAARGEGADRVPAADPETAEPDPAAEITAPGPAPDPSATPGQSPSPSPPPSHEAPEPAPQGTSTETGGTGGTGGTGETRETPGTGAAGKGEAGAPVPPGTDPTAGPTPDPACRADYDITTEWSTGFEAVIRVTTERALDDWTLAWDFGDGQRISQMWDAHPEQRGSRVTVEAAHYNRAVPAGGSLTFGFVGLLDDRNRAPADITLNGTPCAVR
ncbi:cellulose-binding domain-containing protein [Streptomyces sp. NPDC093252]|uniref:cellulose-binding domain-containing protein n=1 Tax=Streptomyces sp. NPDC093252 TaxID=3154980 RepID=UPI003417B279